MKKYNGFEPIVTVNDWTNGGKFIIELISGGEEFATYKIIINKHNQNNKEDTELHVFIEIFDHKKKGNLYFTSIKWDSGEITWEPMKLIKE